MSKPHSDVLDRIVYDLASAIDTPRSLAVWMCYKHSPLELLQLPPTDHATNDTLQFKLDYFITSYLSKYKGLKTGLNLREVALEKWLASETQCRATNDLFRSSQNLRGLSPRVSALIFKAQRKISQVLGAYHPNVAFADCKWASGSTFDILKKDAKPDIKMTRTISVTATALPYLRRTIEHDPHWFYALTGVFPDGEFCLTPDMIKIVHGSRFLTVPKSAKTDRCIAAEPTGNAFLQHSVHTYMKRRLKRFGIDLDNQARNQELAKLAYTRGYATLDLSAASDSISRELVFHLLPLEWAHLLDDLRSKYTRVNKQWVYTEKFASMGNAFCFELETLIFYALASAVSNEDDTVVIYGDDIIVESRVASELIELLAVCGFTVNQSKSFVTGNFYESCGEHYHMGHSVTPVYQKELVTTSSERVRMHNRLIRFGLTLPRDHALQRKIFAISKWVIGTHPDRTRPLIPYGVEADDGYLVDPLRLLKVYCRNHGFKCRVLVWKVAHKAAFSEPALLAYKLRKPSYQNSVSDGSAGHEVSGRWVYATRWIPESDTVLL